MKLLEKSSSEQVAARQGLENGDVGMLQHFQWNQLWCRFPQWRYDLSALMKCVCKVLIYYTMYESAFNHDLTLLQQVMNDVRELLQKNLIPYIQARKVMSTRLNWRAYSPQPSIFAVMTVYMKQDWVWLRLTLEKDGGSNKSGLDNMRWKRFTTKFMQPD